MSPSRASVIGAACETATGGRGYNQDRCEALSLDPATSLWGFRAALIVADGMGGHEKGDQAAQLAVDAAAEVLGAQLDDHASFATGFPGAEPVDVVRGTFERANQRIYEWAVTEDVTGNTGTTLTVIACTDEEVVVGNVGDSRAYVVTRGQVRKLSEEHSWVGEQVKLGNLTEAEAAVSPLRNQLTQAVGCDPAVDPHIVTLPLEAGAMYVACTDGLTEVVDAEAIGEVVHAGGSAEDICRALVALAVAAGTSDNVSVGTLTTGAADGAAEAQPASEAAPEPVEPTPIVPEPVGETLAQPEPVATDPEPTPEPEPEKGEAEEAEPEPQPDDQPDAGVAAARQRSQRLGMALIVCVVSLLLGLLVGRATIGPEQPADATTPSPANATAPPTGTAPGAETPAATRGPSTTSTNPVVVRVNCEGGELVVTGPADMTLDVYPKGKYRDEGAHLQELESATPGEAHYRLPAPPASWEGQTVTLTIDRVEPGTLSLALDPEGEVFVDQKPHTGEALRSVKPAGGRTRLGFYFPSGDDAKAYAIALVGFRVGE